MIGIAVRCRSEADIRLLPYTLKTGKFSQTRRERHLARGTKRRAMVRLGQKEGDRADGDGEFESSERFSTEPFIYPIQCRKPNPNSSSTSTPCTESAPQTRGSSSSASFLGPARFRWFFMQAAPLVDGVAQLTP